MRKHALGIHQIRSRCQLKFGSYQQASIGHNFLSQYQFFYDFISISNIQSRFLYFRGINSSLRTNLPNFEFCRNVIYYCFNISSTSLCQCNVKFKLRFCFAPPCRISMENQSRLFSIFNSNLEVDLFFSLFLVIPNACGGFLNGHNIGCLLFSLHCFLFYLAWIKEERLGFPTIIQPVCIKAKCSLFYQALYDSPCLVVVIDEGGAPLLNAEEACVWARYCKTRQCLNTAQRKP